MVGASPLTLTLSHKGRGDREPVSNKLPLPLWEGIKGRGS
jgi:hypothetical protein